MACIEITDGQPKAYGVKTTPHMFVINPEGGVVYAGAIEDTTNYMAAALDARISE